MTFLFNLHSSTISIAEIFSSAEQPRELKLCIRYYASVLFVLFYFLTLSLIDFNTQIPSILLVVNKITVHSYFDFYICCCSL